jgi:hypothetical protein
MQGEACSKAQHCRRVPVIIGITKDCPQMLLALLSGKAMSHSLRMPAMLSRLLTVALVLAAAHICSNADAYTWCCRLSMSVCSLFLLLAAALYAVGAVLARRGPDYRDGQQSSADNTTPGSDEVGSADESAHLPLLTEPETSERTPLHSEDV